ncbi:Glycosyltransferase, GT2 family [Nocardioides scoriae]|uniref:Glycosyltransferase, GT2 family n=1 Tax=Nocardioides scoriae TaxID=642780 RepID=A0A1H1MWH8_9ACTN|nr:glycosyltransferase [Nocardioides scoriae]SDR90815.1 Glycosyltransferase, GT2 family [Nocardioides scoriae]
MTQALDVAEPPPAAPATAAPRCAGGPLGEAPVGSEVLVGVVVLTQGRRPADLAAALDAVLAQQGVRTDVVVVGNGWEPADLPAGVRGVALPVDDGIPAGRNAGVPHVGGDLLLFLDDDARPADAGYLAHAAALFAADPALGLVHPRVDATHGKAPTRWVPRVRTGDPRRSSPAFVLWEGATVVRRDALLAAGGWPEVYRYAHEGIELVWRVWDAGFSVRYVGDLVALHPPIDPARHATYHRYNARHRVWLARRNLRWPFTWLYVATWTLVQVARSLRSARGRASLRPWFAGWREGWRVDPGGRRPLRWATIWRMTRLGRPPVV